MAFFVKKLFDIYTYFYSKNINKKFIYPLENDSLILNYLDIIVLLIYEIFIL